jgi:hypothetical protein
LESSHPHRFDDEKQSVLDEMGNPYETKEEQDRLLAEAKATHTVLAADPEERQQQRAREAEESQRMVHEEHLSREHNKWHLREVLTQVSIERARAEAKASAPALLGMGTTMRGIRERAQDEVNATILRMQTAREAWENGEATGGRMKGGGNQANTYTYTYGDDDGGDDGGDYKDCGGGGGGDGNGDGDGDGDGDVDGGVLAVVNQRQRNTGRRERRGRRPASPPRGRIKRKVLVDAVVQRLTNAFVEEQQDLAEQHVRAAVLRAELEAEDAAREHEYASHLRREQRAEEARQVKRNKQERLAQEKAAREAEEQEKAARASEQAELRRRWEAKRQQEVNAQLAQEEALAEKEGQDDADNGGGGSGGAQKKPVKKVKRSGGGTKAQRVAGRYVGPPKPAQGPSKAAKRRVEETRKKTKKK